MLVTLPSEKTMLLYTHTHTHTHMHTHTHAQLQTQVLLYIIINPTPNESILNCLNKCGSMHTSHHLHLILLYSPQHLLPTSSALPHDDPSDLLHTMELYCPGKEVKEQTKSNIQIHIITSMYMYGNTQWRTG